MFVFKEDIMIEQKLFNFLSKHQISHQLHHHKAVFSTKESEEINAIIEGAHSKNLFLKDKKKNYVLLSVLDYKKVDLTRFSKDYGNGRFSFAHDHELLQYLGVIPGSVTPYGLLNDHQQKVTFFLDQDFLKYDIVNFHPLRNDMTISVQRDAFLHFFDLIQHTPKIITIPERSERNAK